MVRGTDGVMDGGREGWMRDEGDEWTEGRVEG